MYSSVSRLLHSSTRVHESKLNIRAFEISNAGNGVCNIDLELDKYINPLFECDL